MIMSKVIKDDLDLNIFYSTPFQLENLNIHKSYAKRVAQIARARRPWNTWWVIKYCLKLGSHSILLVM